MELNVKKIAWKEGLQAKEIPAWLDAAGVDFQPIACESWPVEGNIVPKVSFRLVHCQDRMVLHFHVQDHELRAVATEDDGRVWEDSCCEFFVSPEGNDCYYNFECNAIGTLLLHGGVKPERPSAPAKAYADVQRWSSLGKASFDACTQEKDWDLVEVIPVSALFLHHIKDLGGLSMKANFYKCGDLLPHPHYLSWAGIDLPKPQFHCPQFFQTLYFEK